MNRVKRYLRALWLALMGKNPYRAEMEQLRNNYSQLDTLVKQLGATYGACQETMNKDAARIASLQKLVETLRQHIKDKDRLIELAQQDYKQRIEQMKQDFNRTIETYSKELDELRGENI